MSQNDKEEFAPTKSVLITDDGLDPKRRELHEKLASILEKGKAFNTKVQNNPVLSIAEKQNIERQIAGITSIASTRADQQYDDILEIESSITGAEDKLRNIEQRLENKIRASAPKVLENLRAETQECLRNLKESGAESADNILHDKYLVVKRTGDIIGDKQEGEDPEAILNKVQVEVLEARNYGVNNREPYRKIFGPYNQQPSGMEILTARRNPILDKFISVIKYIFTSDSKRNHNHNRNVQPDMNNSFIFFSRTINLPKIKTLDAMPTFSNLEKPLQVKPRK